MKVGILTFHEVFNPGAFLQTLGTVSLLRELGHEPVVIDYTSPAHRFTVGKVARNWRLWRHPLMIYELFGRHAAFQKAQELLPRTRKLWTHADIEKEYFDAVVIGADIVWDYVTPNLGRDPVYFGAHLNAPRKIAFAASCGSIPATNEPPQYVKDGLQQFSTILVRDENKLAFVKKQGASGKLICDPAFHLHVDDWIQPSDTEFNAIVVYGPPQHFTRKTIDVVREYARAHKESRMFWWREAE